MLCRCEITKKAYEITKMKCATMCGIDGASPQDQLETWRSGGTLGETSIPGYTFGTIARHIYVR